MNSIVVLGWNMLGSLPHMLAACKVFNIAVQPRYVHTEPVPIDALVTSHEIGLKK